MNEENTNPEGAPERFSSKYLDIADKYNMNDAELSEYLQYQDIKDDEFNSILNERSRRNQEKAALDQQMLQTKIGQINTEIEQLERQPEEQPEKLRVGALRELRASTLETFGKLDYLFSTLTGGYGSGMVGPLASLPADVRLQMVKDEAEDIREGMREIEGGFMENITPFDGEGNFLDGLNYAFTSIAGSIPSMALIGGTGGAGMYLVGAAEGLSAYHDVKYRKDMSNAEKFGYSLFSGTIEAASEKVSAGIIGKSFKGAKNSIKDNLLSRQFSRGMLKTMGLGGAEEFGAEFSAGVLQSLNQQAFLSDRDIDYKAAFKAGIEGGIIGALGGGAFGGLGYTAGALSVDAAQKTAMEIDSQLSEVETKRKELLRELDNASTEAEKRAIGSLIVDFDRKRAEAFDKKSSRYRVMRRRNPEALQDLNNKAVMIQAAKMRYESATTDAARQVIKSNLEGLINDFNAIDAAALDPDAQLTITEKYQDAMDDINMAIRESEADLEAVADMEPQNDGDLIAVQGVMDRISSLKNLKKNLMRASGEVDAAMRAGKNLEIAKAEAKLDDLLSESLPSDANDLVNKKQVEDDLGQDSSVDTVVEDVETEIPELDVITANSSSLLGDDFVENTKGTEINFGIMGAVNNMLSAFKSANVGVVIHRTSDSYNTARGKSDGASVAFYDKETNNIHLSPKATPNTVKHEFIHGALRSVFDNKEARTRLFNEVRKIANSDPAARDLYNRIVTAYTEQGYTGKRLEEEVIVNFIEKLSEPSVYEQVQQKGIVQKIIDAINRILGTRFNVPDSMLITDKSELMDVVKAFRFAEDTGSRVDVQSLADEMSDGRFDSISKAYPDLIDKEVTYTVHQPSNNSLGYNASYKTVKVRDYFHWRNFWASMTGNGKKDWIVQATYKMDDGRTKLIKKPSPKRDRRTGGVLNMKSKFENYTQHKVNFSKKTLDSLNRISKLQGLELKEEVSSNVPIDFSGNKDVLADNVSDSLVDTDSLTLDQFQPREQSTIDSITTRFKVKLQDRFAKVMMLQEDIEKFRGKPVSESRDFKASEELMHGQTKDSLDKLEDKVKSIAEDMKAGGFSSDAVSDYIYAKHAKERNKLIYERSEGKVEDGSGMSDQRAEEILNSYTGKKKEDMEAIAAKVKAIVEDTRKTYVEFGLESQSTIDAFEEMFKDYVPLSGIASDELDGETSYYPTGGGGLPVYGSTVKKARGRKTQAQNILAQVIAQNAQAKVRGHKNKAMNTLYNLVKDNPNEKVWRITNSVKYDSEHAVGVRVNGEQKYIVFRDASMAKSLKNMGVEKLDFFSKLLRAPAQWLRRSFTTANPEFIISNFARDIQSSVFNALAEAEIEGGMINGKDIALKIVGGVKTTLPQLAKNAIGRPMTAEMQRYFDEFKEDGGQTGWAHIKPVSQIAAEIEAMTTEDSKAKKAKEWMAKNSIEVIENINDAFENSIRLSAYIEARKSGASRTKAAQLAKNITVNFNKHGELGPVANAWFLFFNASIQGTARLGRSLLKLKPAYVPFGSKKSGIQRLNSAQKLAGGLSLLSGMLAMINIALSDEDEDGELFYNKIPDYEKERNLIMMYDGKHYIKIPLPYGFNIFANIGTALTEVSTGNREAVDALNFIAMSTMSSFSPISFGQSKDMFNYLGKAVVPTVFKPVVEIMTNETYFGGSVYREQFPVGAKKPESELGFKSPKNVQEFFKWMNEATGGNEFESGWIDQNPDKFWHIFDYYLGGAGQFLNRSGEFLHGMGASIAEGEKLPMEANDIPFLRKLYGDPSKYYDYQLYTDRKEEIQQLYKTVRSGDYEKGDPKYKGIGSLDKQVKNVEKRLKALRAKRKQAYDLDYFERQKMLAELFEKEREIVMAFNKRYNETRGE